jgi:hypothetical protein
MGRISTILVPVLLAATAVASLLAWNERRELDAEAPVIRKEGLLESENDGLRDALKGAEQKASAAEDVVRRGTIEQEVSDIRDLPFKEPVVFETLDRAGIKKVVEEKLTAAYTDEGIQDMSLGYSALGLLPPNFPLKQTYINLLGEQIGAFYDQHKHELFMFQDATLENSQNRVILAHELTHALQDQNFGLLKLPLEARDDDDRAAAASALVEGDATLVMSQFMIKDLTWKTFADTATFSMTQSMEQIRKAPRYLREMMVFPYIKGQQFCAVAFERGGYAALSDVYKDPPTSTAQILHPEKYFDEPREAPIEVGIADTAFKGAKPLADNVLGEMGCRVLFAMSGDEAAAEATAAGWRGDRYLVYDHGETLVWHTVWRSREAAEAGEKAMEAMCKRRFRLTFARSGDEVMSSGDAGHFVRIEFTGTNEVVLMLTTTKESSDLLEQKFAGASHG